MNFIKNIISFSLKNRFFIFFCVGILLVVGIISFRNTPIEAFPDITNTEITIITQWPGRSAEEMEKYVTIPLEVALNPIQGKTSIRSIQLFGLSWIKIIFDDDVDDFHARQQVFNLLSGVTLPDNIQPQVQPPTGPTGEIYRFTLKSKTRSARDLKTLMDWVVYRQMLQVPGVADMVSFGGEVKTYEISVNPKKLADLKLTPLQVFQAVQKSNINVGGDVLTKNGQAYVVRGIGLLNNVSEIQNVIVDNQNGIPILVKNVADVSESNQPHLGQVGRDTANNVVESIVLMRKGENPTQVVKDVNAKVKEINDKILPRDTKIDTFYNRQNLVDYATHTVLHNLAEGIILVTLIVFIFMADWRTTLIVSLIIPLSLLFAFICLRIKGMNANLLSLGAVDFGIIIDGAVVMVEGIFVALDELAHRVGMEKFNKLSKLGLIKKATTESGRAIFFSKLIILTGLLPIFLFQKIEGKTFSPLAYTLGFALLGALILTMTFVPLMASLLLNKNVREKNNFVVRNVHKYGLRFYGFTHSHRKIALIFAASILAIGLYSASFLGTEFLPQLNEGGIYVRASLPMSISLPEGVKVADTMRRVFKQFAEVKGVISQTGRPDDGTDVTGFYNLEFFVDLNPQDDWKRKETKEELIDEMQKKLNLFPGVDLNFSQPIMDNVEEAVSGVKGSNAVKIFSDDLDVLNTKAEQVYKILKNIRGVEDLGIVKNIGQPELRIDLNQEKMGLYGVATADAQAVIGLAIGGQAATQIYEGEKHFDLRVRYMPEYRTNEKDIGKLLVPTLSGTQIPLSEIADISTKTGPLLVFREATKRFIGVKFSVRNRDLGGTITEAQQKVNAAISLPKGSYMEWAGDFENEERATNRLIQVVPISLIGIFFILFIIFGNVKDSGIVLLNVPFAIIGGIFMLLIRDINFSISAGIGFIALFGLCIQNGVILISKFKHNLGDMNIKPRPTLAKAIKLGVEQRLRPVIMTATMAAIGLLPAALSTGIGSESSRPLATVVIGGLITDTLFDLFIFPIIFELAYKNDKSAQHLAKDEHPVASGPPAIS